MLGLASSGRAWSSSADLPVAYSSGTGQNTSGAGAVSAQLMQTLDYIGSQVYRIQVSTPVNTPVVLVVGGGQLYGAVCSSGSTSGYLVVYDSASAIGFSTATPTGNELINEFYSIGQAAPTVANAGQLDFNRSPEQFSNGLVAMTVGQAIDCYIRARLRGAANPSQK